MRPPSRRVASPAVQGDMSLAEIVFVGVLLTWLAVRGGAVLRGVLAIRVACMSSMSRDEREPPSPSPARSWRPACEG